MSQVDDQKASNWHQILRWEHKGVPLRLEIESRRRRQRFSARRTGGKKQGITVDENFVASVQTALDEIQQTLLDNALSLRESKTQTIRSYQELLDGINDGGFFIAPWKDDSANEDKIKDDCRATIRCYPTEQASLEGEVCFILVSLQHIALFARFTKTAENNQYRSCGPFFMGLQTGPLSTLFPLLPFLTLYSLCWGLHRFAKVASYGTLDADRRIIQRALELVISAQESVVLVYCLIHGDAFSSGCSKCGIHREFVGFGAVKIQCPNLPFRIQLCGRQRRIVGIGKTNVGRSATQAVISPDISFTHSD